MLGTLAVFQWSKHQQSSATNGASAAVRQQTSMRLGNVDRLVEQSLAAKGQLWETMEANGRERMSKTMPVDTKCFTAATTSEIGTDLTIEFSKQIPALQAKVSGRKTETDGTVITHLSVAGAPEGQLTIQENASMGFFVAQLYYQNLPVAYEFKKADDAMVATRHELSEMICSLIDHQAAEVTPMGLPPVDRVRGKKAE